jgi:hypothetical protein
MTNEEALEKYLKQWPKTGYAKFSGGNTGSKLKSYQVGEWAMFGVFGQGDSWEEAFEVALHNKVNK